jgi:predicted negative regulator of RcsB-dependent stress response
MGILNRAADLGQKGAVLGLMSLFGYQVYQIAYNVSEKTVDSKYQHTAMFKKISEKVDEESKLNIGIDNIPDRYDADDNSYLKKVPDLHKTTK